MMLNYKILTGHLQLSLMVCWCCAASWYPGFTNTIIKGGGNSDMQVRKLIMALITGAKINLGSNIGHN